MNNSITGISRRLSSFGTTGTSSPISLYAKPHLGLVYRSLSMNIAKMMTGGKGKVPGSGGTTGGNDIVDSDGYSLDLDEKSQQKLEKFKKVIEKNTYYEKYKAKIVETQK